MTERWHPWGADESPLLSAEELTRACALILTEAQPGRGLTTAELTTLLQATEPPLCASILQAAKALEAHRRQWRVLVETEQEARFELEPGDPSPEGVATGDGRWRLSPALSVARFRAMKRAGTQGALIVIGRYTVPEGAGAGDADSWHLHGVQFALEAELERVGVVLLLPPSGGERELIALHDHLFHLRDEYDRSVGMIMLWPDLADGANEGLRGLPRGCPPETLTHWVAALGLSLPETRIVVPEEWHRHAPALTGLCDSLTGSEQLIGPLGRWTHPVVLGETSGWK